MTRDDRYPGLDDLAARARRRIPHFAWEYLDSGTGAERALRRNVEALQRILMWPAINAGRIAPDLSVTLWGRRYAMPFGVAPVGLGGLIWPGAEKALARAAARANIPYVLSTVACMGPEAAGRLADGWGWFQLYPPRDPEIREDLLARARANGWSVLVVTVDVPVGSRRERQRRVGLRLRPPTGPRHLLDMLRRPAWLAALARHGRPRFWTLEPYIGGPDLKAFGTFMAREVDMTPSWDYIAELRDLWHGPLVVKGVLRPEDAERCVALGVDGIGVSNHGARQFDAAPAAIDCLPAIRAAVGQRARIIFDSGLRGGLDIARALALGADMCLLGRAFIWGVAALGAPGADHVVRLLSDDLTNAMIQMGAAGPADLPGRLVAPPPVAGQRPPG
ncbi:MAG: alpha-hydroxy-acid oxidizing enzyme [Paracoccaceae bacterium]|nr:MAG: alpha-hydroxy-acid oxidizing enzyme [Paracoccaceae bacterium]